MNPDLINLLEHNQYFAVTATAITIASIITTVLPKPKNKFLKAAYKILTVLALNIGKAKNKE